MARLYRDLLIMGGELQDYSGYMSQQDVRDKQQLQARFDAERRAFVYDLIREREQAAAAHIASVSADLDRIEATREYREDAIDYVREELAKHIERQAGNGRFMRFAVRWGPPTLGVVLAILYLYVQLTAD